jgi:MYXO-CTERM domain-containing protein
VRLKTKVICIATFICRAGESLHLDRVGLLLSTEMLTRRTEASSRAVRRLLSLHRNRIQREACMRKGLMGRVGVSVWMMLVLVAFAAPAVAGQNPPTAVPEISGASLSAGLGLLGAGMLWLRARRQVK